MNKYTPEQIETVRDVLCRWEFELLSEKDFYNVLWNGCDGWKNMPAADLIEEFEQIYPTESERAPFLA